MIKAICVSVLVGLFVGCKAPGNISGTDNGKIDVTFLQVNDVYEIAPLEGGKTGGFARVAHLKKRYKTSNPNTYLIMAGDFLSPSVYNSLQFEGKRIRGRQMVETMNAANMDIAVFGNHEFDISEAELQSRLNESDFMWLSSNTFHKKGSSSQPFVKSRNGVSEPLPETYIMNVSDADGTNARIGFIGINIPFNKAAYVFYTDPLATAQRLYARIKDSCDVVIAITHQAIADDIALARAIPELALIIGGHEHDQRYQKVGSVVIAKAHANARSAYVLNLRIDKKKASFSLNSDLVMINDAVPDDPATDSVVKRWTAIAEKNYATIGFDAKKIVRTSGDPLDGREAEIRRQPTNLTRIIVSAMKDATPQSEIAIFNSGSVRVDDILQMPVSQYDILRSLPFGGGIVEIELKGKLLSRILDIGDGNTGTGGFLHYSTTLTKDANNAWRYNDKPLDPEKIYKVAITDFLLTGGESNLEFLKKGNPDIISIAPVATSVNDPRSDIRLAVIKYMTEQPAANY